MEKDANVWTLTAEILEDFFEWHKIFKLREGLNLFFGGAHRALNVTGCPTKHDPHGFYLIPLATTCCTWLSLFPT